MTTTVIFDPEIHRPLLTQFVDIHIGCIEKDNTIATFTKPLNYDKMLKWWSKTADQAAAGSLTIFMALSDKQEVMGFVYLSEPDAEIETGPYRGEVLKLLVSPNHRQKGVAKSLMKKLEEVAVSKGRTLLVRWSHLGPRK